MPCHPRVAMPDILSLCGDVAKFDAARLLWVKDGIAIMARHPASATAHNA